MYNMILVSGVLHNDFGPLLLLSVSYLFLQSFHLHLSLVGLLRIASDLFSSSLLFSSVDLSVECSILITIAFHPINTFWFIFKAHPVTYFNSIFPLYRVLTLPLFVDDLKSDDIITLPPVSARSVICSSWECGSAAWSSLALRVWTTHPCGWSFSRRACAAQTEALYGTLLRSVHGPELLVSCFSAMGSWTVNALGWACGSVCSCTHFKTT